MRLILLTALMPFMLTAAENQATDRAHRIGQDKAVFVYKLIVRNTVEEKVQKLQQFKQGLADQLFARHAKHLAHALVAVDHGAVA